MKPEHCPICNAKMPEGMTQAQLAHILQHGVQTGEFKEVGIKDGLPAYTLTKKGKKRAEQLIASLNNEGET